MRTPALRLGAGLATGIALAAGVLTATPAVAAVGDDDPTVGARVTTGPAAGLAINEVESNADDTDWVELGELVTESYRLMAPRRLAARLDS